MQGSLPQLLIERHELTAQMPGQPKTAAIVSRYRDATGEPHYVLMVHLDFSAESRARGLHVPKKAVYASQPVDAETLGFIRERFGKPLFTGEWIEVYALD